MKLVKITLVDHVNNIEDYNIYNSNEVAHETVGMSSGKFMRTQESILESTGYGNKVDPQIFYVLDENSMFTRSDGMPIKIAHYKSTESMEIHSLEIPKNTYKAILTYLDESGNEHKKEYEFKTNKGQCVFYVVSTNNRDNNFAPLIHENAEIPHSDFDGKVITAVSVNSINRNNHRKVDTVGNSEMNMRFYTDIRSGMSLGESSE